MKKYLILLFLLTPFITKAQQIPSCQFAEVSYNTTTGSFQYHCPNSTEWVTIPNNGNGNGNGGGGNSGLSGMVAGQIPLAASATTVTSSVGTSGTGNVCFTTGCSLLNPALNTPTVTKLTLGDVTGSTQCLHVNSSGLVTGTGLDCGSGGGGGNGNVANPLNSTNLSNGAFPLTINGDVIFQGPAPYIDARDYGARTMDPTLPPAAIGITANCFSGSNQVTVSNLGPVAGKPNYLKVGDGVDLVGCGSAHAMTTPSQPTVASVEDQGGIGTNYNVAGPNGSTTRYYQIALMNSSQGITAASPELTFSTGMATDGSYSATISSCSKSGTTVTCTTAAPHNITNGAKIRLFGTSNDKDFGGHFTITSVGSSTFTYTSGQSTAYGSAASATGGTAYYYIGDQVTLPAVTGDGYRYLIYISATSGTETLYGISIPQTSTLNGDTSWNKWSFWGFPITVPFASSSLQQQISYIPQSPPTQARNDTLVTTITAINGNTLTLAANAGATVSNAQLTFDNAPAVKAANTQAQIGGTVVLPTEDCGSGSGLCYYVFNSQASENNMAFGRPLWLNDTLFNYGKLQGLPNSSTSDIDCPSFSSQCPPVIAVNGAYPGVYNNDTLSNVTIKMYGNSGIGVYEGFSNSIGPGGGGYTHQDHVVYTPQNPTIDYSNIFYYGFGAAVGSQFFGQSMDHVEFLAAEQTSGSTDAPAFIMKNAGNLQYDYMNAAGRGYFWEINTGGQNIQFNSNIDWQAVITPLFSTYGVCNGSYGGHVNITNVQSDTSVDPIYWTGGCSVNSNAMQVTLSGVGGNPNTIFSGWPNTAGLTVTNANVTNLEGVGQNYNVETDGATKYIAESVLMGNPGSIGVGQLATPGAPVVTVTTSCSGGNIMTGNWSFAVVWFDITGNPSAGTGGHSNYGPASATNSFNGTTQCASVAQPTPPAGAYYWGLIELLNNNITSAGWANEGAPCPGVQMVGIGTTTLLSQNVTCQLPGNPAANTSALQYITPTNGIYGTAVTDTALTSGQCVMAGTNGVLTSSGGSCGGAGSTGTVTTFSAGTLSPLFTTSVATATTTPALTFTLSNAAQNSVFAGPPSGGAAAPSFQTAPTISAANMTNFPTFNQATTGKSGGLTGCTQASAGDICYWNGSAWVVLTGNTGSTHFLQETSAGVPSWTSPSSSGNTTSTSLTTNVVPVANGANSIVNSSITDNGTTVSTTEPITSTGSITAGTGPSSVSTGTGGVACTESTSSGWSVAVPGADYIRCDSGLHQFVIGIGGSSESTIATFPIALGSSTVSGTLPVANIPTAIPIGSVGSAGLSGTSPVAITSAGAISVSAIPLTSLANQAADTVVGNGTGGSTTPTALAMPTSGTNGCAGATNALQYNTSTHAFTCNTSTGGGGGTPAFSAITSGTNTSAAMVLGSGGSIAPTSATVGTVTANGLMFGSTTIATGTIPSTNQCLEYNGTNITGTSCSVSLPTSYTWTPYTSANGNTNFSASANHYYVYAIRDPESVVSFSNMSFRVNTGDATNTDYYAVGLYGPCATTSTSCAAVCTPLAFAMSSAVANDQNLACSQSTPVSMATQTASGLYYYLVTVGTASTAKIVVTGTNSTESPVCNSGASTYTLSGTSDHLPATININQVTGSGTWATCANTPMMVLHN